MTLQSPATKKRLSTFTVLTFACLLLFLALLTACQPGATPSAPPAKTLIPTSAMLAAPPPLTPDPVSMNVTTRAGQTLFFGSIRLEPNEYVAYHTESLPQGIPLANGVEIDYDYIAQVDFGLPSPDWDVLLTPSGTPDPLLDSAGEVVLPGSPVGTGTWPVTVTLTSGTRLIASLGFKAHHQIHLTGQAYSFGYLDLNLVDIQHIVFQRNTAPRPIPSGPPGEKNLTVETLSGDVVVISDPKIFARCMYAVYCCHDEALTALPVLGKADIALEMIRAVVFPDPDSASVTLSDGQTFVVTLRPPADCPGTGWRLRGKAALGDFEIMLALVKRIEN